jgi:hypothetical protein
MSRSGWLRWLVLQRVGVGHHVAAHPVGVDQLEDARLLADLVVVAGRDVGAQRIGDVRDAQRVEDLVVEALGAEQQLGTRRRKSPDWAPWITRWSYVDVSVMTLLTALSARKSASE